MARSAKPSIRGFKSRPRLLIMSEQIWQQFKEIETKIDILWRPFHLQAIKYRPLVIKLMTPLTLGILIGLILTAGAYLWVKPLYFLIYSVGAKAGVAAVFFYVLSLLPGIFKRLNILTLPRTSLMLYRRETGQLAFLAAVFHAGAVRLIPKFLNPVLLFQIPFWAEIVGFWVLMIFLALYLTSNDVAIAKLGKLWAKLHRFTYVALGLLLVHVAWYDIGVALFLAVVGAVELLSFTRNYWQPYLIGQGKNL